MSNNAKNRTVNQKKRTPFNQSEFPLYSLEAALRIPQAIYDHYAGHPTAPLDVAISLQMSPSSSNWRYLTGAVTAYELSKGGYRADRIELTPLSIRIVAPTEIGDDLRAKREAILKPRIMREFYQKYNNAKFPDDTIAGNVLVNLGLPRERVESAVRILKENARQAQIIKQAGNSQYLDLDAVLRIVTPSNDAREVEYDSSREDDERPASNANDTPATPAIQNPASSQPNIATGPNLHIDIQIHISADASSEQIDTIFESMAKHLYGRSQ